MPAELLLRFAPSLQATGLKNVALSLECARNAVANRWLRHSGVLYCCGNNISHMERGEFSFRLSEDCIGLD